MTKEELIERVKNDFIYHPPDSKEKVDLYEETRNKYLELALWLIETRPLSRDLSLALTELEDSMFRANGSLARNS